MLHACLNCLHAIQTKHNPAPRVRAMLKNSSVVSLGVFSKFCTRTYLRSKVLKFGILGVSTLLGLKRTRYWNGPAHFVALHLKHVPRTNLQKCRRSNTSLCHFQSPWSGTYQRPRVDVLLRLNSHCPLDPAWLLSTHRGHHWCISQPKMPCCQKNHVLANLWKETHLHRLP